VFEWAEEALDGPIIYGFWKRKQCLYVGKGKSWRRLKDYQKHIYLREATRLNVFCVNGRDIPMAECLAIHLYRPRDNVNRAANKKWSRACPICKKCKRLNRELRELFRLR
jgi:hypothetical protein